MNLFQYIFKGFCYFLYGILWILLLPFTIILVFAENACAGIGYFHELIQEWEEYICS